jgi:microtubule-associated protein-like 6
LFIEILKLSKSKKKLLFYAKVNAGITSALLHLDWDVDSQFMVVNSQAYELKFVDVNSKK